MQNPRPTRAPSALLGLAVCLAGLAFGCEPSDPDDTGGTAPTLRDRGVASDRGTLDPEPDGGDEPPDAAVDAGPDGAAPDMMPRPACADGVDNDGDGATDHPADPGCADADDDDEVDPPPQCGDGVDNDEDGAVDLFDGDCLSTVDPTEGGGAAGAACGNGVDDDGDGFTDFPWDPGCRAAGDIDESDPADPPVCGNGVDDDEDGLVDHPADPGCQGVGDGEEADLPFPPACADGEDNDENGVLDYPADPGCDSAADPEELNPCGDIALIDLNAHLAAEPAYDGDLADLESHSIASCGGRAGGEVAFVWRVDRLVERLVFTTEHPETAAPTVLYVRRRCDGLDVGCDRGNGDAPGASVAVDRPDPGVYFVLVDTGSRQAVGAFRLTVDVQYPPQCRDGVDNDEDGLLDADDVGCAEFDDDDETDPAEPPVCSNGVDDDDDGLLDYPEDDVCLTAGFDREQPLCDLPIPFVTVGQAGGRFDLDPPAVGADEAQGSCGGAGTGEGVLVITLDDPSDVNVRTYRGNVEVQVPLYARAECVDPEGEVACRRSGAIGPLALPGLDRGTYYVMVEQQAAGDAEVLTAEVEIISNIRECNDLVDNDGDGRLDLDDPGCERGLDDSEADPPELPECADGQDNDGDGATDYPDDDGCGAAGDDSEGPVCLFTEDVLEVGPAGGEVEYSTLGQPSAGEGSCGGGGPQAVVAITVDRASSVRAVVTEADYDTLIYLRAVCDDGATELACNDDDFDGFGTESAISVARVEPGTYFLLLDGFLGRSGSGTVDITVTPL